MAKPITIRDFQGMQNVKKAEGPPNQPTVILNSFVTPQGRILKKNGNTAFISLSGAHSLSRGCSVMLCVAADVLYRIDSGVAISLGSVTTHGSKMNYVEVNDKVYMSCKGWTGIYDIADEEVTTWGLTIPDKPVITGRGGDLPPGTYSICYTSIDANGQAGGNSEIVQVSFENQTMGIQLVRRPSNCLVWITDTNGGEYYLAGNTSDISTITSPYNSTIPLPSLDVILPPKMTYLHLFAGRIWGCAGEKLYYSEAGIYEWFKNANSFEFSEDITGINSVDGGLYVNSKKADWFLTGTDPLQMQVKKVGNGSIAGAIAYIESRETGESIPVWIEKKGLTVGGQLLMEDKLDIPFVDEGAGLALKQNGINQVLFTLKVSENMATDLDEIFRENRLYQFNLTGSGGLILSGSGV